MALKLVHAGQNNNLTMTVTSQGSSLVVVNLTPDFGQMLPSGSSFSNSIALDRSKGADFNVKYVLDILEKELRAVFSKNEEGSTTASRKTSAQADQFYQDLFVTAMEGGVNFWAEVQDYDPSNLTATLIDLMDGKKYEVNRSTLLKGYKLAQNTPSHWWSIDNKPPMIPNEEWDYDAWDANLVVQLGLFEDMVYG